jgi:metal-sulfur cluster biosynthetic enzyme
MSAAGTLLLPGTRSSNRLCRLTKGTKQMADFTAEQARDNLKNVYDPEIGINIVDLGLVYDVDVSDTNDVLVTMTLTSLGCPLGPVIVQEVTSAMSELPNLGDVDVKLVWSPAWSPDMMSEDARDELGIW